MILIPQVLDDLLATFGPHGIEVFEGQPNLPSALEKGLENEGEDSNEVELALTLGTFEKTAAMK